MMRKQSLFISSVIEEKSTVSELAGELSEAGGDQWKGKIQETDYRK
jgi:hypothetical protein